MMQSLLYLALRQSGASFSSSDLPAQVDKFSIDPSVLSNEANFMGLDRLSSSLCAESS